MYQIKSCIRSIIRRQHIAGSVIREIVSVEYLESSVIFGHGLSKVNSLPLPNEGPKGRVLGKPKVVPSKVTVDGQPLPLLLVEENVRC